MQTMIERLQENIERYQRRIEWHRHIAEELPDDLPTVPTIANEKEDAFFGKPGAWLSFSRSYGEEWAGRDILFSLERAGFLSLPASLVKWDDYRRSVEPGHADDIPDTKGRYQLTEVEEIAPVYIIPDQHGASEAITFYQSPAGLILRVKVPAPTSARIQARRIESRGDWRFEQGTAKVHFPGIWHSLNLESGECVSTLHSTPAWVDTQQGISGRIYWAMLYEPNTFPLTNAEFLQLIEAE